MEISGNVQQQEMLQQNCRNVCKCHVESENSQKTTTTTKETTPLDSLETNMVAVCLIKCGQETISYNCKTII